MTTAWDDKTPEKVPDLPEDLAAICLDTNAMGHGRLNIAAIEDLVDVIKDQELDIVVLIPEPVLWEWAEHLAAELAEVSAAAQRVRQHAFDAGALHSVPDGLDKGMGPDAVVEAISASLVGLEGVKILPLRPNMVAVDALRDQILLRGPARKKKDVKTGAADSAAFRLIQAEHARIGGTFMIVSGDQDAWRYFSGMHDVVSVSILARAKAGIVAMRRGSEVAADRVREAVKVRLPAMTREELGDPVVGPENAPAPEHGRGLTGVRILHLMHQLTAESVISVPDVEVSRSDGYAAVVVEALVQIQRDLQVLSDRSDAVEMDVDTFDGLHAMLEVSAESGNGLDWDLVVDRVRLT